MHRKRLALLSGVAALVLGASFVLWQGRSPPARSSAPVAAPADGSAGELATPGAPTTARRATEQAPSSTGPPDHAPTSASAVSARLRAVGPRLSADLGMAAMMAMDLCDQPQLVKRVSVQSMIERAERQGSPAAATLSRQAVARFCDAPVELHPALEAAGFNHDALLYQAEPRLHRLDELITLLADPEVAATARAEAASLVGELLAKTDSFSVFQHVGSEAAQRGLLRPLLAGSDVLPRGVELQDDVAANAVLLAGCQRFGGCGAGTPMAMIQCLAHCERPMGLVDQMYWRLPPSQVDSVERVAAWLAARRLPGA